jgi:hypothetical protein
MKTLAPVGARTPTKPSVDPQIPAVKNSLMTEKEDLWTELYCVCVKEREGEEGSSESDVFYDVALFTCRSSRGGSAQAIYYAAIFHHKIIAKLLENRVGFSYRRGGV